MRIYYNTVIILKKGEIKINLLKSKKSSCNHENSTHDM